MTLTSRFTTKHKKDLLIYPVIAALFNSILKKEKYKLWKWTLYGMVLDKTTCCWVGWSLSSAVLCWVNVVVQCSVVIRCHGPTCSCIGQLATIHASSSQHHTKDGFMVQLQNIPWQFMTSHGLTLWLFWVHWTAMSIDDKHFNNILKFLN